MNMRFLFACTQAQRLTWHSNSSFTVHSSPVLDFPGSSKFTTEAEITVSSDGAAGTCKCVPQTLRLPGAD